MNFVKKVRKERGVRIEELAERTGLSLSYLFWIDKGYSKVSEQTKAKIAKALGVEVSEVFPREEQKESGIQG